MQEALTHSSFANENPHISPRDNERLEYLGDAVLQLITAEYLYKVRPEAKEGEMTQVRSAMVNTNTLATLSEEVGIGNYLYLGKGIAKGGGRNLRSLLANAFEAVLGAIFLDAGYDAAFHYCLERFNAMPDVVQDENYKGMLQQVVQERFGVTPYYDSVGARGPGGRMREYTAVVYAGGDPLGTGHGRSKQTAEQSAAKDAIDKLLEDSGAGKRSRRARRRSRPDEQLAADFSTAPNAAAEAERPEPVESVLPELRPDPESVARAAQDVAPAPARRPARASRGRNAQEPRAHVEAAPVAEPAVAGRQLGEPMPPPPGDPPVEPAPAEKPKRSRRKAAAAEDQATANGNSAPARRSRRKPRQEAPTPAEPVSQPPAESVSQPPAESASQPPPESTSQPPTESASPPPAESASPPPTESASPPPAESASPPPAESASLPPAESASPPPAESASPPPAESASPPPTEFTSPPPAEPVSAPSAEPAQPGRSRQFGEPLP